VIQLLKTELDLALILSVMLSTAFGLEVNLRRLSA
jgi:hypothetical protein